MGFFDKWKKKSQQTVETQPKIDRVLVEDYLDQGYGCKEIAQMCNCDEQAVYNTKQAKQRREARIQGKAIVSDDDPVAKARQELEVAKLNAQLEEIKVKTEEIKLRRA